MECGVPSERVFVILIFGGGACGDAADWRGCGDGGAGW